MIRTLIVEDDFRVADIHRGFLERLPAFGLVGTAHTAAQALEPERRALARTRPRQEERPGRVLPEAQGE